MPPSAPPDCRVRSAAIVRPRGGPRHASRARLYQPTRWAAATPATCAPLGSRRRARATGAVRERAAVPAASLGAGDASHLCAAALEAQVEVDEGGPGAQTRIERLDS